MTPTVRVIRTEDLPEGHNVLYANRDDECVYLVRAEHITEEGARALSEVATYAVRHGMGVLPVDDTDALLIEAASAHCCRANLHAVDDELDERAAAI